MEFSQLEASSTVILENGTVLTRCSQCREMWAERNARGVVGSPPCHECRVDLDPANLEAADIYRRVKGQGILYFNGEATKVIDINHNAVWSMIDHYPKKLKDPWDVFEKVVSTFHHFLRKENGD